MTKTILFLGANPSATTRIALDVEIREITDRLRRAGVKKFRIEQEWAVRLSSLQEALMRHRPTIVHFSGHGERSHVSSHGRAVPRDVSSPQDAGALLVEGDNGEAVGLKAAALASLFAIFKVRIKCVVLNACYSEAQASEIQRHIDCVVGMSSAIDDRSAIAFSSSFYQALGFGESFETAFNLGQNAIELLDLPNGDAPKLLARADRDLSRLVLANTASWAGVARSAHRLLRMKWFALVVTALCVVAAWRVVVRPEPKSWGFWRVQLDLPGDRFAQGAPLDVKVRADHAGYVWVFSPDHARPGLAWPHPDDERLTLNTIDANEWRPIPLLGHDHYGIAAASGGAATVSTTEELILIVTAEPSREAALRHLAAMRPELEIKATALASGEWGASAKSYVVVAP